MVGWIIKIQPEKSMSCITQYSRWLYEDSRALTGRQVALKSPKGKPIYTSCLRQKHHSHTEKPLLLIQAVPFTNVYYKGDFSSE